jgi:hypothetical protein
MSETETRTLVWLASAILLADLETIAACTPTSLARQNLEILKMQLGPSKRNKGIRMDTRLRPTPLWCIISSADMKVSTATAQIVHHTSRV